MAVAATSMTVDQDATEVAKGKVVRFHGSSVEGIHMKICRPGLSQRPARGVRREDDVRSCGRRGHEARERYAGTSEHRAWSDLHVSTVADFQAQSACRLEITRL